MNNIEPNDFKELEKLDVVIKRLSSDPLPPGFFGDLDEKLAKERAQKMPWWTMPQRTFYALGSAAALLIGIVVWNQHLFKATTIKESKRVHEAEQTKAVPRVQKGITWSMTASVPWEGLVMRGSTRTPRKLQIVTQYSELYGGTDTKQVVVITSEEQLRTFRKENPLVKLQQVPRDFDNQIMVVAFIGEHASPVSPEIRDIVLDKKTATVTVFERHSDLKRAVRPFCVAIADK